MLRTTCPLCGDVDVPFASARLLVAVDAGETRNLLEFDCPACRHTEQHWLDERSTRLLVTAGIEVAAAMPVQGPSRGAPHHDRNR